MPTQRQGWGSLAAEVADWPFSVAWETVGGSKPLIAALKSVRENLSFTNSKGPWNPTLAAKNAATMGHPVSFITANFEGCRRQCLCFDFSVTGAYYFDSEEWGTIRFLPFPEEEHCLRHIPI